MAKFSEINNKNDAIPQKLYEDLQTCLFCGSKFNRGGCWSGFNHHIGVCGRCTDQAMALLIDTLRDTMGLDRLSHEDQVAYIKNIAENRLIKDKGRKLKK